MKSVFLVYHLVAVLLAAIALWSMRHELNEKATVRLAWVVPPALAVVVAAILLIVSPGKRFELWAVGIALGLAIGLGAGTILKVNKDFERKLVRVHRAWDGVGAAALLLLATLARVVSSDVVTRQSGKFGVLGASAAFLAAYLVGRAISMYFYNAPRTIHLDMIWRERARTS